MKLDDSAAPTYRAIVANVYSSADSYRARSRTIGPYYAGLDRGAIKVTIGPAPRWLFDAVRQMQAIDLLRGGSLAGWLEGLVDRPIALEPNRTQGRCFTTIVLELPEQGLDVRALDEALEKSEDVLAEAALLVTGSFAASLIENEELRGLFFQRRDRRWVKYPELRLGVPTVGVSRTKESFDDDARAAAAAFQAWRAPSINTLPAKWAMKALLSSDPWSEFVRFVFSLEQLAEANHRLANRRTADVREHAEGLVKAAIPGARVNWRRPGRLLQFAALAARLSPGSAGPDTVAYLELRTIRNGLLHGDQLEAPDNDSRARAKALAVRYNRLALIEQA